MEKTFKIGIPLKVDLENLYVIRYVAFMTDFYKMYRQV